MSQEENVEIVRSLFEPFDGINVAAIDWSVEAIRETMLAVGGRTNFFGLESVERNGFGLKDLDEAVNVRNQILRSFELAQQEPSAEKRRAHLTIVVVGAAPTGVDRRGEVRAGGDPGAPPIPHPVRRPSRVLLRVASVARVRRSERDRQVGTRDPDRVVTARVHDPGRTT